MRFFKATLTANSYLYFYSTEFLKTTTVSRILHNWALMFALNEIKADPSIKHLENLKGINFYCTPAIPKNVNTQSFLLNPVPDKTEMQTDKRMAGQLTIMRIEKFVPGSEFEFFVMSRDNKEPPRIINYGKKRTHHTVAYDELKIKEQYKENITIRPKNLINPLDFKKIDGINYAKKYPIKPSPLYNVEANFYDIFVLPQFKLIFPANFPY